MFQLFKTLWGVPPEEVVDPARWPGLLRRIKADGFDGIEVCHGPTSDSAFPFKKDLAAFHAIMKEVGLVFVVLVPTVWAGHPSHTAEKEAGLPQKRGNDVAHHVASFKALCEEAATWGPALINVHSGKDSFTLEEAVDYFAQVAAIEATLPCPVAHETHRARILHSPFVYRDLMTRLPPTLKVTADLSHWAAMAERCPNDADDAEFWPAVLADLAKRTIHIHARVGWSASAQVPDPFAPEHAKDVDAHLAWWDTIVAGMRARKVPVNMEPEFGPYPYMPHLPHTNVPVADLWHTCTRFGEVLRQRFAANA